MDLKELLTLEGKENNFMEIDTEKHYRVLDIITGIDGLGWSMRYLYDFTDYCYDILSDLTYVMYLDEYQTAIGLIKYKGKPSVVYRCIDEEDYKFYIIDEEFNSIINKLKEGYNYAYSKIADEYNSIKWLKNCKIEDGKLVYINKNQE